MQLSFLPTSSERAYVLGFFAADGNITVNKNGSCYVEFTSTDRDAIEKIRDYFALTNKISVRKGLPQWKDRFRLQIGSKHLVQELENLGFTRRKSHRMVLPDMPDDAFPHFVRGYFDGDGNVLFCFYPRKNRPSLSPSLRVVFVSSSQFFLEALFGRRKTLVRQSGDDCARKGIITALFLAREILWPCATFCTMAFQRGVYFSWKGKRRFLTRLSGFIRFQIGVVV